jgi:hypothetical protein
MSRVAILVRGYSKNEAELASDKEYISHYITFLQSTAGGGWEDDEILIFEEPTLAQLEEVIELILPEFVLLIMIGHGATQEFFQLFQINENTIIQAGQLALDVNKQLVILESCRTRINNITTVDLADRIPQFKYGGVVRAPISLAESRDMYKNIIAECPNGLVVCYACGEDQVASSYFFSRALLFIAFEWHLVAHAQYFPITNLMPIVRSRVENSTKRNKNIQSPSKSGDIPFPFAISKF